MTSCKVTATSTEVAGTWLPSQYPVSDARQEAQVVERTPIQVYQWLRDVCSTQLLQTSIKLGGTGMVMQIDELLYRHEPKVCAFDTMLSPSLVLNKCIFVVGHPKMRFGVWNGRHLSHTSPGIYADCA